MKPALVRDRKEQPGVVTRQGNLRIKETLLMVSLHLLFAAALIDLCLLVERYKTVF